MAQDRVSGLLAAYFNKPYPEYGEAVLQIRQSGGLDSEELRFIQSRVLLVDANAIIRHAGTTETAIQARASSNQSMDRS